MRELAMNKRAKMYLSLMCWENVSIDKVFVLQKSLKLRSIDCSASLSLASRLMLCWFMRCAKYVGDLF